MTRTVRYELIGAYRAGIKEHPQKHIESLGFKVLKWHPAEIGDCIIIQIEGDKEIKLPDFITEIGNEFWKT